MYQKQVNSVRTIAEHWRMAEKIKRSEKPRTWSLQLPYIAYATEFSPIKLFLALFLSTFSHENGTTVPYAYALIL